MNVRNITILILIIAMGYIAYSYSQKSKRQSVQRPMMQQSQSQDMQKMATTQAKEVNQKVQNTMTQAEDTAQAMKEDLQAKADVLIKQAKSLLASGKLEEAMAAAKEVLSKYAPDSQEAKNIIEQAKKMIAEKAAEMKEGAVDSVKDVMGSFGQ